MKKKRKRKPVKKISHSSARSLAVGTLKGKTRKLIKRVVKDSISDENILYASTFNLVAEGYEKGYEQCSNERRWLKDARQARHERDYNRFREYIEDITNQKK